MESGIESGVGLVFKRIQEAQARIDEDLRADRLEPETRRDIIMHGCDEQGSFGFSSVGDWLNSVIDSFPVPWSIAPLAGKYYGTVIMDARGTPILSVWRHSGDPSVREKSRFGSEWTMEAWREDCCDCHWESEVALTIATAIVQMRNDEDSNFGELSPVADMILKYGKWEEAVFAEVACGGPLRRRIER